MLSQYFVKAINWNIYMFYILFHAGRGPDFKFNNDAVFNSDSKIDFTPGLEADLLSKLIFLFI